MPNLATSFAVADQVAADLNASGLDPALGAVRKQLPLAQDLARTPARQVFVVPSNLLSEREARSARQRETRIDVAVVKKVASAEAAEVGELAWLAEEIGEWFFEHPLTLPGHAYLGWEFKTLFDPQQLLELSLFLSVLTLKFRSRRFAAS